MANKPIILITIDVEDWFQVENLRNWISSDEWGTFALRVEKNTRKILDLLDNKDIVSVLTADSKNKDIDYNRRTHAAKIKATFFVLGWIAQRVPNLVREIHARGHEVASHGYSHIMCNLLDLKSLEVELVKSKKLLEEIIGDSVKGYRAPSFSINNDVIKLLKKIGYSYDSSFNSFSKHGRYGHLGLNGFPKKGIAYKLGQEFSEIPISNLNLFGRIIPWGGGGYFRLIPPIIFKTGIKRILKQDGTFMFYLHPWEIDHGQPRIEEASGFNAWRHYKNLDKTFSRLRNLILSFDDCYFLTCSQYLEKLNNERN